MVLSDDARASISRYPSILDNLTKLTRLSISRGVGHLCSPSSLWHHLSKLVNLNELHLTCAEAESWLLEEDSSSEVLSKVLPGENADNGSIKQQIRLKAFAATFSNLRNLSLRAEKPQIVDLHFQYFPPSITSLSLPQNDNLTIKCLEYFPGNELMELNIGFNHKLDAEMLRKLPKTLTTVSNEVLRLTDQKLEKDLDLPNLRTLKLKATGPESYFQFFSPAFPAYAHLTNLVMIAERSNYIIDDIPAFPATLEKLSIWMPICKSSRSDRRLTFPPKLTKLCLISCDINGLFEDQLPATLTDFVFHPHARSGNMKLLTVPPPPALTRLNIIRMTNLTDYDSGWTELLPQLILPPHLTEFVLMRHHYLTRDQLSSVPRSVTSLAVRIFGEAHNCLALLPPHLTRLGLRIDSPFILEAQALKHLSPYLTDLDLEMRKGNPWSEDHFEALPSTLLKLKLTVSNLTDDHVKLLPRSLTEFTNDHYTSECTGNCFAFLPHELRLLKMHVKVIKDDDFKLLPRYLKNLYLIGYHYDSQLTPACLTFLPTSLSEFRASNVLDSKFPAHISN